MPQTAKEKAVRYSLTEQLDALAILRSNKFNYTRTARELKISVPSLRTWYKKYSKQLEEVSEVTEAMVQTSENLQEHKKDFMAEVYDTKLLIIQRVRELVPSARSIRVLSEAMEVLHSMEVAEVNPAANNMLQGQHRDFILNFVSNQIAVVSEDGKIIRQNKLTDINQDDHGKN